MGPDKRSKDRKNPTREPQKSKTKKLPLGHLKAIFAFIICFLIFAFIVVIAFQYKEHVETILTVLLSSFTAILGYFVGGIELKNELGRD
jgi:hypothetical protein